jgi:hypothetical protein
MKKLLACLLLVAGAAAGSVHANGSPYSPGLSGFDGVTGPKGAVRFVTVGAARGTVVAAVRVSTGKVLRSRFVPRFYGVPIVSYDGTTGGLSGDGKTLVLGSYGPLPGEPGVTRFLVLSASTLALRRTLVLRGAWSFDALSPRGTRLYLVEHLSAGPSPLYRVRDVDLVSGALLPQSVIDRAASEAIMRGEPSTRATSAGGRWAYTLYARRKAAPFIHALDTARRLAYCIDLPLALSQAEQTGLRLRLRSGGRELAVIRAGRPVASVDTRSFVVHRH